MIKNLLSTFVGMLLCIITLQSHAQNKQFAGAQTNTTGGLGCIELLGIKTCEVINPNNAVTPSLNDFSTLRLNVALIDAFASQTLIFGTPAAAQDSLVIQLQDPNALLDANLLGRIIITTSLGGVQNNDPVSLSASNIKILNSGAGIFQVAYRPQKAYDRVTIRLNAVVGVLTSLRIYSAYTVPIPVVLNPGCDRPISQQVTVGGLCVACTVENPEFAIDNNDNSFAQLRITAALLGVPGVDDGPFIAQRYNFAQVNNPGKVVTMVLESPVGLLDLNLLGNVTVRSYLGGVSNGDELTISDNNIRLLPIPGSFKYEVIFPPNADFDAVEIRLKGGLVGLLETIHVYSVCLQDINLTTIGDLCTEQANAQTNSIGGLIPLPGLASIANPNNAVDGDYETSSTLSLSAGLLTSNIEQTLIFPRTFQPGDSVAIVLGAQFNTLNLGLLANITINSLNGAGNSNGDNFTIDANNLKLLNTDPIVDGNARFVVVIRPTKAFDRVSIQINGGLLSINSNLDIFGACVQEITRVVPPAMCVNGVEQISSATPLLAQVINPDAVVDADPNNFTTLSVTLGLLEQISASQTIRFDRIANVGDTINIIIEDQGLVVDLSLLTNLVGRTFLGEQGNSDTFTLLGAKVGALQGTNRILIQFVPTKRFDRIQLELTGGLLGLLNSVRIFQVCLTAGNDPIVPPSADGCEKPFATEKAISPLPALCLSCDVINPNFAIDNDFSTFSTLQLNVGVLPTAFVQQTFVWNAPSMGGEFVSIILENPAGLLDASVLSSLSVATYLGNTFNNDRQTVQAQNLRLIPIPGSSRYELLIQPTAIFDRLEIRLTAGLLSAFNSLNIYDVCRRAFDPFDPAVCDVQATTETNSTAGVVSPFPAPVSNANNAVDGDITTFSTLNVNLGLIGSVEQTLIFPSTLKPGDSLIVFLSNPQNLVSLSLLGNVTIETINGPGNPNNDQINVTASNISLIDNTILPGLGNTPVYAIVLRPTKAFDRVSIRLNGGVLGLLSSLNIHGACVREVMTATLPDLCENGIAQIPRASALIPGLVEAGVNNPDAIIDADPGNFSELFITLGLLDSFAEQEIIFATNACSDDNVTVIFELPNNIIDANILGQIEIESLLGAVPNNDVSPLSTQAVRLLEGTNRFIVTFNPGGAFDRVIVRMNGGLLTALPFVRLYSVCVNRLAPPILNPSNVTSICSGTSTVLRATAPAGAIVQWFDAPTGGTLLATGDFTTPVLTVTTTYYVQSTYINSGCSNPNRVPVTVTIKPAPALPVVAVNPVTICAMNTATLNASVSQPNVVVRWFAVPTGGMPLFTGNSFTTPVLNANTTYYAEATDTLASCPSSARVAVNVIVNPTPAAPQVVSNNVAICPGDNAILMVSNPDAALIYTWFLSPTGGVAVASGPNFTVSPTVNTTYYVQAATSLNCASLTRTSVLVIVNDRPANASVVNNSPIVCTGESALLTASSTTPNVRFEWFTAPSGGTPIFTGALFTTPALSATTTFYVSVVSNTTGCVSASRTPVTVTVTPRPNAPILTPGTNEICQGQSATLVVTSTTPNVEFRWYETASASTPIFVGPAFTTPTLQASRSYFVEAVSLTSMCASSPRTEVQVIVNPRPLPPSVDNNNPTICAASSATITASSATPNVTFIWYNQTGGLVFVGATFTTPQLNTTTIYFVEAVGNVSQCNSASRTQVTVNVVPVPPVPTAIADNATICSGDVAVIRASGSGNNVSYRWFSAPNGGTLLFTGEVYTTNPLTTTTTFYVEAVSNGLCVSASRTGVTITVNPRPAQPLLESFNNNICSGQRATISARATETGTVIRWFDAPSGGNLLFTGATFTTPILTASTTYYAESVSNTGCVNNNRTAATVNVNPLPANVMVLSNNQNICAGQTATFQVANPNMMLTYRWFSNASGGNPLFTGTTFTTPALNTTTSYFVEAFNANQCASSARTQVTATVIPKLVAPLLVAGIATSNTVNWSWNAVPGAIGYQISVDGGQSFVAPSSGSQGLSHTISGLQLNTTVTLIVRAISSIACAISDASNSVSLTTATVGGLFIPNIFTPNGDGVNDKFFVRGKILTLDFQVFNQWGELVFKTNDPNEGWDGTFKGELQPTGVFVYTVEATLIDGTKASQKGTVTLVR